MPRRPLRPCTRPGCPALVERGACPEHRASSDQARGSARARGYDRRWEIARRQFLLAHPLCAMECATAGRVTPATVVDHIVPHRGDQRLFWDRTNWQPGCASCHSRKTAREDGGFGNRRRG